MSGESRPEIKFRRLTGRCLSGTEGDRGTLVHAVIGGTFGKALCGKKPGQRSNGFSSYEESAVDCPKCLKAIQKMKD